MKSSHIQKSLIDDHAYLEIWKADQEFVRTRWTIVTFFMSVSFAIFAYSFQIRPHPALAIRIFCLFIYWFSVTMHAHFYQHNSFLRNYLIYLENSGHTTLNLQSKLYEQRKNPFRRSTGKFLAALGLIYAVGIVWLFFLQI